MRKCGAALIGFGLLGLAGCAATSVAPPAESPLSGDPFTIIVPKDLNGSTNGILKGVRLGSFNNVWGQSPIRSFFSVSFVESATELTTEICRGDLHDHGSTFKSCVFYDSRITVSEEDNSFKITLTPYRVRVAQGRNPIFLPIGLPEVNLKKWYGWLSSQTVVTSHKATSQYGPESIKGNFDRKLQRYSRRELQADAALKQFKDTYVFNIDNNSTAVVGTSIYPYKNGTLVEMYIEGRGDTVDGLTIRDWTTSLTSLKKNLDEVVKD